MPHTWCVCSRDVGCRYLLLLLSLSPGDWWMFFPSLREYERPELLLSTSCPLVWLCMIVWTVTLNHIRLSFSFPKLLETLSACSLFTNLRLFLTVPVREKHLVCKENLKFWSIQGMITPGWNYIYMMSSISTCILWLFLCQIIIKKKGILMTFLCIFPNNMLFTETHKHATIFWPSLLSFDDQGTLGSLLAGT